MNPQEQEELKKALETFLNEGLERIVVSNPKAGGSMSKVRLRPLLLRGALTFQAEEQVGNQAFHRNMDRETAVDYVTGLLEASFRQAEIASGLGTAVILVSKKGKMTVKVKRKQLGNGTAAGRDVKGEAEERPAGEGCVRIQAASSLMGHNRRKRYILEEGVAVPFLVDLGVMTPEGKIVNSRYDKYRQINRFLEFIEDVLASFDRERETTIIDFGCGKSYLTFAMYYYLKVLKGYPVRIIGLDLKEDVIHRCNRISRRYGYDTLRFCHGDIASYEGVEQVDMVVTLHACDTATDFALAKAVSWGAKVILSVPCCQHELNGQMENRIMKPVWQYGLIRERMAALCTDAIRALALEHAGYKTQILEFIEMEHTPKNVLIRAVRQGRARDNGAAIKELTEFLGVEPTIVRLLLPQQETE